MTQEKRKVYPIEIVISVVKILQKKRYSRYVTEALRPWMPYCIRKMENGMWQIQNRDYKPLGLSEYGNFVNYYDYDFICVEPSLIDFSVFQGQNDQIETGAGFFYSDLTWPRNRKTTSDYLERLNKAFKI